MHFTLIATAFQLLSYEIHAWIVVGSMNLCFAFPRSNWCGSGSSVWVLCIRHVHTGVAKLQGLHALIRELLKNGVASHPVWLKEVTRQMWMSWLLAREQSVRLGKV